jgi:predicted transcriptional regulator
LIEQRFLNSESLLPLSTNIQRGIDDMKNEKKPQSVLTSVIETEMGILQRHIKVLKTLMEHQPMGIIKLSELTNYPQHMVRYSLRILEQDSLVEPSSKGAVTTENLPQTIDTLKKTLKEIVNITNDLIQKLE